ncbi:MAG TPA: hypothetical protein PKY64_01035 [Anaerolineaceae bacterium]|nr:hypothetical protein [Anaerolineaceae bacterium]
MGSGNYNAWKTYWANLEITTSDLQQLANHLFEKEEPLNIDGLLQVLIDHRLKEREVERKLKLEDAGEVYLPSKSYEVGAKIRFPEYDWKQATVVSNRPGDNVAIGIFSVTEVEFEDGTHRYFATNLSDHALNTKLYKTDDDDIEDPVEIQNIFAPSLRTKLRKTLEKQSELIRIADTWFPRSLLIDINKGYLNLAEAILDSHEGGPLGIEPLMKELELNTEPQSKKLLEFSLNYALQEDPRFDEVGTTGEISWFLKRLEPESVLEPPIYIRSNAIVPLADQIDEESYKLLYDLDDELSFTNEEIDEVDRVDSVTITLTYPHWRSGSIPVTPNSNRVLPSALESENIKISFIDKQTQQPISAWVVRSHNYVVGLKDWFEQQNLIPGSNIEISATKHPGTMLISSEKKRSNKEWIKTVLIGADGGLVFALLRQPIYAGFNERMAIAIPDRDGLDKIWQDRLGRNIPIKSDVFRMMNELSKLNSQHHVHFVDLYAAINVIRRTPPMELLEVLATNPEIIHVGDHYYHLADQGKE